MKRPLAAFGFSFLGCMLLALRLPAPWLYTGAAVVPALFLLLLLRWRRLAQGLVALLLGAAALAFLWLSLYSAVFIRPIAALSGSSALATARVSATQPAYSTGSVHASLQLRQLNGQNVQSPFAVQLRGIPAVAVGDIIEIPLEFYSFQGASLRSYNYGRGFYIGATATAAPRVLGQGHTPLTRMRTLQYAISANICARLPLRLSGVAAAMAVGDRRFIPPQATYAYRAGGISHMLVVSGLHLSLLCGFVHALLRRLLPRRKKIAALINIAFVLAFMAFTGFSYSVIRSGLAWLLVFSASLFRRQADILTSLGFAALLLLLANPYAAGDIGLLLSFTATLGALGSGALAQRLHLQKSTATAPTANNKLKPARAKNGQTPTAAPGGAALRSGLRALAGAALSPLCVVAATLPVQVYAGLGVSLFSIPVNLLAVPLLPFIVLGSFVMAIPPAVPVLGALGSAAALPVGILLRFLEWLTNLCAGVPGAILPVGGLFALVVLAAVYLLVFVGQKSGRLRAGALLAGAVLCFAMFCHLALNAGTVRVLVAGGGANPSLVIVQGRRAVVLYRSRQAATALQQIFQQNRIQECVLFIDLRQNPESTEYIDMFSPTQLVVVQQNLLHGASYSPLAGVQLHVLRQGEGSLAFANIGGYRLGLCAGSVNLAPYPRLNLLLAGSGSIQGEYDSILVSAATPATAGAATHVLQNSGQASIWLRPGRSVRIREVLDEQNI